GGYAAQSDPLCRGTSPSSQGHTVPSNPHRWDGACRPAQRFHAERVERWDTLIRDNSRRNIMLPKRPAQDIIFPCEWGGNGVSWVERGRARRVIQHWRAIALQCWGSTGLPLYYLIRSCFGEVVSTRLEPAMSSSSPLIGVRNLWVRPGRTDRRVP